MCVCVCVREREREKEIYSSPLSRYECCSSEGCGNYFEYVFFLPTIFSSVSLPVSYSLLGAEKFFSANKGTIVLSNNMYVPSSFK